MTRVFRQTQQGAALLVSMLFLLILTIIGVSALSNSSMEARIAHNFQLNNTVFHAAETAIDAILFRSDRGSSSWNQTNDPLFQASNAGPLTLTDSNLGLSSTIGDATLTMTGTTTETKFYEDFCPGRGGACIEYTITTTAGISGSAARTTHTQVVTFDVPKPD